MCMCHKLELLQSNQICLPVASVSIVEGVLTQYFVWIVNILISIWCRFEDLLRSLTINVLFGVKYCIQYFVQI